MQSTVSRGHRTSAPCARRGPVLVSKRRSACSATGPKAPPSERRKVVCVGESLFDLIADQKGVPRDKVRSWTAFAGGAPCNVATALGKLGLPDVLFVTALGKDERGEELLKLIQDSGVRLDAIQRRDEPTRDVYVVRDDKGDREFAGFGLPTDQYCDCFLDAGKLPLQDIKEAAVLVTGTLGLAYPATRDALHKAAAAAKEGGCKLLVDVNWRPVFWEDKDEAKKHITEYLQKADLIKLSDTDLEWLLGMDMVTAILNPCAVSANYPNAKGVLVTAGDEGAAYCFTSSTKGQHSGFVRTFQVKAVDTTGAGDCFTAGFIYQLLQAGSLDVLASNHTLLKQAVVFASACGALTTTRKGAIEGQPSLEECSMLYETSKEWYNFW